jgi:hypothetical protein
MVFSPQSPPEAALTIARMPALIASGSFGHASTTAAKAGSPGRRAVAISVAVGVRLSPRSFASMRDDGVDCFCVDGVETLAE